MKRLIGWLCLVMLGGLLVLPVVVWAQDDGRSVPPAARMALPPPAVGACPVMPGRSGCARLLRCLLPLLAVIHVLLAFWVYTDIKKRGEGHGIFIVLALLGGIPATILYAIVRIGDRKT